MNKYEKVVEDTTLSDEELAEQAEMIYNFKMGIDGIKNLLWQMCRKQIKATLSNPSIGIIDDTQELSSQPLWTTYLHRNGWRKLVEKK